MPAGASLQGARRQRSSRRRVDAPGRAGGWHVDQRGLLESLEVEPNPVWVKLETLGELNRRDRPLQLPQQREHPGARRLGERVVGIDTGGRIDQGPRVYTLRLCKLGRAVVVFT